MKEQPIQTVVVNAFGGPGAGKTTSCWEIASELKKAGYCVEYVSEYAKELVWEGQMELLDGSLAHQQQLFCEQQNRQERLMGKVDLIVTDAPLPQNLLYCREHPPAFYQDMVLNAFQAHTNFNYLMERDFSQPVEERGRIHTLAESQQKDTQIKQFLQESGIYYGTYSHQTVTTLVQNIQAMFERVNQMEYDWEHQDFDTYLKTYVKENLARMQREPEGILRYPYIVPGSDTYATTLWDWDSWWTCIAMGQAEEEVGVQGRFLKYEKGCILNFLDHMDAEGRMPILITNDTFLPEKERDYWSKNNHKPVLAQHAAYIVEKCGDLEWLREHLPELEIFVLFYKKYATHKDRVFPTGRKLGGAVSELPLVP